MRFLIATIVAIVAILPAASALEGSFLFQSVGYGRGWPAYTCLVDHNITPIVSGAGGPGGGMVQCKIGSATIGLGIPSSKEFQCPFEDSALEGYPCNSLNKAGWPTGVVTDINIPEDIKLVTKDGFVLKSTTTDVCPDDSVSVQKGSGSGEWWYRGGADDSPPIQWIPDVEAFVKEVMDYHKNTETKIADIATTDTFSGGYVDKQFSIDVPIYSGLDQKGYQILRQIPKTNDTEGSFSLGGPGQAGALLCSLKKQGSSGSTIKPGDEVDVQYDVLCTFYYFAKQATGSYENIPGKNIILRHPTIIQATPATTASWGIHNVKYQTIDDLFKVGTIKLNTKLKVVEPTKVRLAVQTKPSQVNYAGKEVVKLVITNTQTGMAQIDDVDVGAGNEIIFCDKKAIGAGESAECLASVGGAEPVVKVSYSETSCGKEFENLYVSSGEFAAGSCETDFDCKAGACCAGLCRANGEGTCEDIDGNGVAETWVPN